MVSVGRSDGGTVQYTNGTGTVGSTAWFRC